MDIATTVGWIATVSSVIQFWAIADPVREIRAVGTSLGKKPYSLYGMIFGTLWWTVYGFYTQQWAVVACDGIGLGFAVWGIEAFLSHPATAEEFLVMRNIVIAISSLSVLLIGFALIALQYDDAVFMLGIIASVGTVAMISGPLAALKEMIRNKDVHLLVPRIMAICGITAALWTLYAILYNDMYQFPPNFIGFCMVLLQAAVYFRYRNTGQTNTVSPTVVAVDPAASPPTAGQPQASPDAAAQGDDVVA